MTARVRIALALHRRRVATRGTYEALEIQFRLADVLRALTDTEARAYRDAWARARDSRLRAEGL
ncbi:MAG TPA: hypothetical protein VHH11_13980 [Gammaproteobacteria bacterium]|nr:hypothetical protein [Gammaproteobacteria bacterium]